MLQTRIIRKRKVVMQHNDNQTEGGDANKDNQETEGGDATQG